MMRYQDYINSDAYGCYIILKINKKDVLESMRKGTFWFRHPAFYNCEEDKNGNTTLGDKYDDKLRAITNCDDPPNESGATMRVYEYSEQDENRQISFYKLRLGKDCRYEKVDAKMRNFGDSFALIDKTKIIGCLREAKYTFFDGDCFYCDDDTYVGECGSFFKRIRYNYQNEYRISIRNGAYSINISKRADLQKLLSDTASLLERTWVDTPKARYAAYDELMKTQLKIEEIKSEEKEIIYLQANLLSETISLTSLLDACHPSEW